MAEGRSAQVSAALRWALPATAAAIFSLAGCSEPPPAQPSKRAVRTVTLAPREVSTASRYAAALEPKEKVDLAFKAAGKVRSLAQIGESEARRPIQEGDRVQRGQELARLDDDDFQSQARAAAAGVSSAEAQIRAAEAALQQASAEHARAKELREGGAVSQADLDRSATAVRSARANLEGARSQRLSRSEQQALARGAVEDAALLSPIDGVVARRMVEVGSSVSPGSVAFTVMDPSQMRAVFGVPDLHVAAIRLGDRVPIHLDALPGKVFAGAVSKIHPLADPLVRSFAVEVTLANPDGELRAGMVATAALALPGSLAPPNPLGGAVEAQGALLVPLTAVVRGPRGQGFAVWAVDPKTSQVVQRPIEPGDLSGNDLIVLGGLRAGERIVSDGAAWLHDGERVEVRP